MQSGYRKVRGIVGLLRVVPLLTWSLAAIGIAMGPAVAVHGWLGVDWINFVLTLAGCVLFQGVVAHAVNELMDWRSGTDRLSKGVLSGGAKVLQHGLLRQVELKISSWLGFMFAAGVAFLLSRRVGAWIWWVFGIGCWSSLAYSLSPLRLAYRPLTGEWLAAWPATYTCVYAGARIMGAPVTGALFAAASLHATLSVSWLMQHHLPDIPADLAAVPPKITTVAWVSQHIGRANCRIVVAIYYLLAACVATSLWTGPGITALPTILALLGVVVALSTDPSSVISITVRQWVMICLTLINAVVLSFGFIIGVW